MPCLNHIYICMGEIIHVLSDTRTHPYTHTQTHTDIYIYIYGQTVLLYHNSTVRLGRWDASYIYIYIIIHGQTVLLYHNSTVRLGRWDASYIYMYHHHHHHQVVPPARISLTISRHFSLSFIASGRSSGLHATSSHSCCM